MSQYVPLPGFTQYGESFQRSREEQGEIFARAQIKGRIDLAYEARHQPSGADIDGVDHLRDALVASGKRPKLREQACRLQRQDVIQNGVDKGAQAHFSRLFGRKTEGFEKRLVGIEHT